MIAGRGVFLSIKQFSKSATILTLVSALAVAAASLLAARIFNLNTHEASRGGLLFGALFQIVMTAEKYICGGGKAPLFIRNFYKLYINFYDGAKGHSVCVRLVFCLAGKGKTTQSPSIASISQIGKYSVFFYAKGARRCLNDRTNDK